MHDILQMRISPTMAASQSPDTRSKSSGSESASDAYNAV